MADASTIIAMALLTLIRISTTRKGRIRTMVFVWHIFPSFHCPPPTDHGPGHGSGLSPSGINM
jgi:hypothetical protein